ncbi:hypothetical protein [Dactylosporangium sp. NPDC048998]|uniref:hypothetical protein n=1 Tax=Dactylosporangium sp. NPDC048998 TaxID=3363976 RepID=UPI00371FB74A
MVALDDPHYAGRDDLIAYTAARLSANDHAGERAGQLAVRIADSAYPLFLVAQLTVDALTAPSAGAYDNGPLPTTVAQALDTYLLRAFTLTDARRARTCCGLWLSHRATGCRPGRCGPPSPGGSPAATTCRPT